MNRRRFLLNGSVLLAAVPGIALPGSHNTAEKIKLGIIGTGIRGIYMLLLIKEHLKNIEVVACCDVKAENLRRGMQFAAAGARSYKNYKDLIGDRGVEAIVIATPLHLHYEMSLAAIASKKHVYCEKTMCYSITESKDLVARVKSSNTVFQVGYQQRYSQLFRKVKQLIQNGSCGKITYIDCFWNRNGDWRRLVKDPTQERLVNWRMYKEYSGGLMAELCSHQIDLVHMMLEKPPLAVTGMGAVDYWKDGRETFDNVTALFEYPDGIKARFNALTTNAHEGFSMKFYGTKATIEVNRKAGQKGWIFQEMPPSNPAWEVDALTGVTQTSWDGDEGIIIHAEEEADDEVSTTAALADFCVCIHTGEKPAADVIGGHWGSVAVAMANLAMTKRSFESWKSDYNDN